MPESVYVFKVALSGSKRIWRRIAMRPAQTLDDLHEAIFTAFDRYDEHLYSFFFPKRRTTSMRAIYDSPEYTHPDVAEEPDPFTDKPVGNAARTKLSSLGLVAHRKFLYLFDFGDEWWRV